MNISEINAAESTTTNRVMQPRSTKLDVNTSKPTTLDAKKAIKQEKSPWT